MRWRRTSPLYVAFAGEDYYPNGGAHDAVGAGTFLEASRALLNYAADHLVAHYPAQPAEPAHWGRRGATTSAVVLLVGSAAPSGPDDQVHVPDTLPARGEVGGWGEKIYVPATDARDAYAELSGWGHVAEVGPHDVLIRAVLTDHGSFPDVDLRVDWQGETNPV